jgi:type IV pilus assembly protein PilA
MNTNKRESGFTLIELMIVVAIIAILAAIALPAYQDYVIRSQVSEGSTLADGIKSAVWDFSAANGRLPLNNASAGLPASTSITGKFVSSVAVTSGLITATFSSGGRTRANSAIDTKTLIFSPIFGTTRGSTVWTCQPTGTVPSRYLPTICRSGTN